MPERDPIRACGRGTWLRWDGMTWPNPDDPDDVEWRIRHAAPTRRGDQLAAASFMHAYRALVWMPERQRNAIIRRLREGASPEVHTDA